MVNSTRLWHFCRIAVRFFASTVATECANHFAKRSNVKLGQMNLPPILYGNCIFCCHVSSRGVSEAFRKSPFGFLTSPGLFRNPKGLFPTVPGQIRTLSIGIPKVIDESNWCNSLVTRARATYAFGVTRKSLGVTFRSRMFSVYGRYLLTLQKNRVGVRRCLGFPFHVTK